MQPPAQLMGFTYGVTLPSHLTASASLVGTEFTSLLTLRAEIQYNFLRIPDSKLLSEITKASLWNHLSFLFLFLFFFSFLEGSEVHPVRHKVGGV